MPRNRIHEQARTELSELVMHACMHGRGNGILGLEGGGELGVGLGNGMGMGMGWDGMGGGNGMGQE